MISLILDLETTGINPTFDRICEIACIVTDWKSVYAVLSTFVNPGFAFHNETNGLSLKECGNAPSFRDLAVLGLTGFLSLADEYVGHNLAFDLRFLRREMAFFNLHVPLRPTYDTLRMERGTLQEVCMRRKIDVSDVTWHTALGDCVAAFRLAQQLKRERIVDESDVATGFSPVPR